MNAPMVDMDIRSGTRTLADALSRVAALASDLRVSAFTTTTTKFGKTTL